MKKIDIYEKFFNSMKLIKEDSSYAYLSPKDKQEVERYLITVMDLISHGAREEEIKNLLIVEYDLDENLADEVMKMAGV